MKEKLNKKNDEFQEDMKNFNDDVSIKSEEFKRNSNQTWTD